MSGRAEPGRGGSGDIRNGPFADAKFDDYQGDGGGALGARVGEGAAQSGAEARGAAGADRAGDRPGPAGTGDKSAGDGRPRIAETRGRTSSEAVAAERIAASRMRALEREQDDRKRAGFATALIAFAVGVPPDDLMHPTRLNAPAAFARHAAMYLCHVAFGMSLARVALAFRRDRSTVAHACHRMEDRREDRRFDAWMDALESSARHAHVELAGDLS